MRQPLSCQLDETGGEVAPRRLNRQATLGASGPFRKLDAIAGAGGSVVTGTRSWDAFIAGQQLSEAQAAALRDRLMADRQIRLAETFATYVADRLPAAFWDEPASLYRWRVDALTGKALGGSWETGAPRAGAFAGDRRELKRALKRSYQARSRFIHVGERGVGFSAQLLSQIPGHGDERLSFAALRSALRKLIVIELESRSGDDPLPPLEVRLGAGDATSESAT